ncbi:hypothetical protein EVAR_86181_1 [Eumeta japonica]|uniref:Uncharacterized protein n=1 Tax=Eumeta variegata TaxID=151549 RepID=A0A4C1UCZ2_EUMVA|nr:hypothetical protein EVAR_86181_1 [Eumeta japonica]
MAAARFVARVPDIMFLFERTKINEFITRLPLGKEFNCNVRSNSRPSRVRHDRTRQHRPASARCPYGEHRLVLNCTVVKHHVWLQRALYTFSTIIPRYVM